MAAQWLPRRRAPWHTCGKQRNRLAQGHQMQQASTAKVPSAAALAGPGIIAAPLGPRAGARGAQECRSTPGRRLQRAVLPAEQKGYFPRAGIDITLDPSRVPSTTSSASCRDNLRRRLRRPDRAHPVRVARAGQAPFRSLPSTRARRSRIISLARATSPRPQTSGQTVGAPVTDAGFALSPPMPASPACASRTSSSRRRVQPAPRRC